MHWVSFIFATLAFLLYADRLGALRGSGGLRGWALVARLAIGGLLLSLVTAAANLAWVDAPFEFRHWLVLLGLVSTTIGLGGLKFDSRARDND